MKLLPSACGDGKNDGRVFTIGPAHVCKPVAVANAGECKLALHVKMFIVFAVVATVSRKSKLVIDPPHITIDDFGFHLATRRITSRPS